MSCVMHKLGMEEWSVSSGDRVPSSHGTDHGWTTDRLRQPSSQL